MNKDAAVQVANIPKILAQYQGKLQFSPKGIRKGDLKGQPYFTLQYALSGVTARDEEELLTQTEEFLVNFSEKLR